MLSELMKERLLDMTPHLHFQTSDVKLLRVQQLVLRVIWAHRYGLSGHSHIAAPCRDVVVLNAILCRQGIRW